MKKGLILLICILFVLVPRTARAQEETPEDDIDATLSTVIRGLDLDAMEQNLYQSELAQRILGGSDLASIIARTARGEGAFKVWDILEALLSGFLTALKENLLLVLQLLAIAMLLALLGAVGPSVLSGGSGTDIPLCGVSAFGVAVGQRPNAIPGHRPAGHRPADRRDGSRIPPCSSRC